MAEEDKYWFDSSKVRSWKGYMMFVVLLGLEILLGFVFNFRDPTSSDVTGFLASLTALLLIAIYVAKKKTKK